VTLLTLAVVAAPPAGAVDMNAAFPDLNLPGFKITPFFTERVEYESNIFQTPSRAEDDVIFRHIPGILVELPYGEHRLDLGVRVEVLNYLDNSDQDTEHYFLLGHLALNFPGGLKYWFREDFAATSIPPGTELTGRIDNRTNVINTGAEYAFVRRWSLGADYTWTHVDFDNTVAQLDRDEHLFGVTGYYKVQPRTDVLLNFSAGTKDFEDSTRDVDRFLVMGGVRGYLTPRLTSTFRLGYENRDQEARGRTDYSGLVASGDFVFRPLERTTFTLVTTRSVEESVFSTNLWYLSTIASLSAEHQFTRKFRVFGRVFGGWNEYPDKAQRGPSFHWREDALVGLGLGFDYQIQRWLGVGMDWTHTRRDSNFDIFDYTDDIVGAKVTLSF
jgi:hypothetical protein